MNALVPSMRPRLLQWRKRFVAFMMWPLLALAAIVTQQDIINAILNSPTANQWLRDHATEIAALAMFESRGDTYVYNGSCCYGVLQMSGTNIRAAGYTVDAFRNAPLQAQINAWSSMQSTALSDPTIAQLTGMSTFDGQPVDAAFVLACIQLGQGNCRTMLNSGSCGGFRDSNGTSICDMANQIRRNMGLPTAGPGTGTGTGTGTTGTSGGGTFYSPGMLPAATSPGQAFTSASGGNTPTYVSQQIALVAAALVAILVAWAAGGQWTNFVKGRIAMPMMANNISRGIIVLMLVLWLLN
jgi:Protein of unknown function (DUF3262)